MLDSYHSVVNILQCIKRSSYTRGEHSIVFKLVRSLCCMPEMNIMCVNYTQVKTIKKKRNHQTTVRKIKVGLGV